MAVKTRESGMPDEEMWRGFFHWAVKEGFRLLPPGIASLPPYHYGMILGRP